MDEKLSLQDQLQSSDGKNDGRGQFGDPSRRFAEERSANAVDRFHAEFLSSQRDIHARLKSMLEGGDATSESSSKLDEVIVEIKKLKEKVHDRSAHLLVPSYISKTVQASLKDLDDLVESVKDVVRPKKKFTFGSLKSQKKDPDLNGESSSLQVGPVVSNQDTLETEDFCGVRDVVSGSVIKTGDETHGKDFHISNIASSTITITGVPASLYLDNIDKSTINSGPVKSSVFVRNCSDSTFHIYSQQLRIHETRNCVFKILTKTSPIIEDCSGLTFDAYDFTYDQFQEDVTTASIDSAQPPQVGGVVDFNWLSSEKPSPNFEICR